MHLMGSTVHMCTWLMCRVCQLISQDGRVPVGYNDMCALLDGAKRQSAPCTACTQHHNTLPRQGGLRCRSCTCSRKARPHHVFTSGRP